MQALKARRCEWPPEARRTTDLSEGTVVELVPADQVYDANDHLTDEHRAHVHREIIASMRERRAGGATFDADEVMDELAPKS